MQELSNIKKGTEMQLQFPSKLSYAKAGQMCLLGGGCHPLIMGNHMSVTLFWRHTC